MSRILHLVETIPASMHNLVSPYPDRVSIWLPNQDLVDAQPGMISLPGVQQAGLIFYVLDSGVEGFANTFPAS
jgi:hypothetical protein